MILISNYIYLNLENIDTDLIIPKQFLNTTKTKGFNYCLFFDLRYIINKNLLFLNKDFLLNNIKSKILISNKNFGCGSSREHSVWSLKDFNIKVIIAENYNNIFYENSMKNNLFLIFLKKDYINKLLKNKILFLNIKKQFIKLKNNYIYFYINSLYKNMFLKNFSFIDFILRKKKEIFNFLLK